MAACLSKLDAVRDLSDTGKACPSGLIVGSLQSSLSPDGRYLFEPMNDRGTVFDLTAFPAGPGGTCPAGATLAWEDATHLIVQAQDGQFRCDVTTFAASRIAPLDPGSTLVRRYVTPA
jgi:hypothetical protein